MDYKVLYRKYRPDNFSSIVGQDYMVSILKNAIKNDKISHAYIFSGPRGTGKTSTAKVFAKAINCLNPTEEGPCNECESCLHFKENADIIEIDAASNNGVDEIREIINNIKLAPAYSKYKVYIIDEVHMLSTSAFNALLLTLEEPPKHVVFILATTNIEAVPITILSRCQRFDFHKISIADIIKRLKYVISNENIAIDDDALEEIAYISDGGMRDALSILDQLSSTTEKITINDVIEHFGSVSKKQINDLFNLILENDVDNFDNMMKKFKELAIDYKVLIKKMLEKIEEEAIKVKKNYNYQGLSYDKLKEMAFNLADISNYVNMSIDPYLLIEITLLKYFPGREVKEKLVDESIPNDQNTTKIISREIIKENPEKIKTPAPVAATNEETPAKIISREIISQPETYTELIKIRVNNCFVNAKKEYLQNLKEMWKKFVDNLSDKSLLNLLIDCNVVTASDKVGVLTNIIDGTSNLINNRLKEVEDLFNKEFNTEYKFIALTEGKWNEEKQEYIKNLHNKHEYRYIEEPKIEKEEENDIDNIEKIAYDIFDKEKIEIE
ncbi:MAG TPA: DNA polymerase III subunit gamma/tau [Candidatus Caccenecus avistercoris]|nr:DNA polymerase III subunit gamma/tau [Candidatus Caccenecus avistercoris]